MGMGLPVYGVVYDVSAYYMGKLPNQLPKQVVRGSNPLARSKHRRHTYEVKDLRGMCFQVLFLYLMRLSHDAGDHGR